MPLRINPQTIIGIIDEKLTNKPELQADVRTLATVVQTLSHFQPADCDSGTFKLQMQETVVAAISAAGRLLDEACISALRVSSILSLERFAVLHFASVQRALLLGLESVVGRIDYKTDKGSTETGSRSQNPRAIHEDIQRLKDLVKGLDVPYTLAVNPSSDLGVYYEQQVRTISALIGFYAVVGRG